MVSNADIGSQSLEKALNTGLLSQPKVLIVEDELVAAETIARTLRQQGFDVVGIVDSGELAIQQAALYRPDLILMDIVLRGAMDGIAAAEQICKALTCAIVYTTAYTDDSTLQRAKLTEPYGYLIKPFKPHHLKVCTEITLKKYQSIRASQAQVHLQLQTAQHQLVQLVQQDPLTKLPNWTYLQTQFEQWVNAPAPTDNRSQAVASCPALLIPIFCLSVDRLHRINHYWGHEASDRLLQAVAQRLTLLVRSQGVVARTDLNEFTIIFNPVEQDSPAIALAQNILEVVAQPFFIQGRELFVTASLGGALYPKDGKLLNQLMRCNRTTIDRLQQQGGNRHAFHQSSGPSHAIAIDPLTLETDLRYALERQELRLVYQPKVSLNTGQIIGGEALLRWQHPQGGTISPKQFIPLAEETGMIEAIGEWVLFTACHQLKTWHDSGLTQLRVAVNLSGCQLRQPHLHQRIMQILSKTQLHPQHLELELTESTLIEDVELASQRLQALKAIGVQLAIDDFGTGYSSLSLLHRFLFDILKLDRCFVRGIHFNSKNRAIATAIIAMAHQLNLKLVAEGVETNAELGFLCEQHCDEMQGYLFSRPLPAASFETLLRNDQRLQIAP
jgi:diguanylate cyclase (GGDEF)-like protein